MSMTSRYSRERLIDEVKKYPVLYDTKHENHKDVDVRDRCWQEISDRLAADSEVLKREWKILRDSLRQAVKRSREGATTKAGEPCKKWRFQNRMAFILPYVTVRRRREIKPHIKLDDAEYTSDAELAQARERADGDAWDAAPDTDRDRDHEALDLFFASVCQSTKRLSKRHQASVKRQVLDVLLRAEEDADADEAKPFTDVF